VRMGKVPFHEPGLDDLGREGPGAGRALLHRPNPPTPWTERTSPSTASASERGRLGRPHRALRVAGFPYVPTAGPPHRP
jgi:hypothetical protein